MAYRLNLTKEQELQDASILKEKVLKFIKGSP